MLRKSNFSFPNAAKTGFDRIRIDSSTISQSISGSKKRKAEEIVLEPTQIKLRPFKEVKKGTNTCSWISSGVIKPPRQRHIYVGRLSQHITTTEMEKYCATNNVDLLHVSQISKPESVLKSFHCVFRFDDKKIESPKFWPKKVTVQRFYLNNTARE